MPDTLSCSRRLNLKRLRCGPTALLGALLAALLCACAAPDPRSANAAPALPSCPIQQSTDSAALYGDWTVTIEGQPAGRLHLQRHPEYPGSVSGSYQRQPSKTGAAPTTAQVVGDLEQGQFTLEESDDGQHTSGRWSGLWVAPACNQEIQGTWLDARQETPVLAGQTPPPAPPLQAFRMRRDASWQ